MHGHAHPEGKSGRPPSVDAPIGSSLSQEAAFTSSSAGLKRNSASANSGTPAVLRRRSSCFRVMISYRLVPELPNVQAAPPVVPVPRLQHRCRNHLRLNGTLVYSSRQTERALTD
jgi:hypothetical protein